MIRPQFSMSTRRSIALGLGLYGVVLCGLCGRADGVPVSPDRVRSMVTGWLRCNPQAFSTGLGNRVTEVRECGSGNNRYFAVYLHGQGFVLVPGDDRVRPVLAFSGDGRYEPVARNPLHILVSADLQSRMEKVMSIAETDFPPPPADSCKPRQKWLRYEELAKQEPDRLPPPAAFGSIADVRIEPLIDSRWGQTTCCEDTACYNYYTPPADPNDPATCGNPSNYWAGCMATALAQLVRYHQMEGGFGGKSYQVTVDGETQWRRTLGGDGQGGPYRYDLMPARPDCSTSEERRQAIGALCYDIGVALRTSYSSTVSGAALNFRTIYDLGFRMYRLGWADYQDISDSLVTMVNPSLDARLPCVLSLSQTQGEQEIAHEVILDGYGYHDGTMYHHLNLGWEGSSDAWYDLPEGPPPYRVVRHCLYNLSPEALPVVTRAGVIISGRILDEQGLPLENATVQAIDPNGFSQVGRSDAKGIYAVYPLYQGRTYTVQVQREGYVFVPRHVKMDRSTSMTVEAGNRWAVDFRGTAAQGHVKNWFPFDGIPCPQGDDFVDAAVGQGFGLALRADGSLAYWGLDTYEPLLNLPMPNSGFVDVACGNLSCLAVREDGTLEAWGWSLSGVLDIPEGLCLKAVEANQGSTAVGLTTSGGMVSWGRAPVEIPPGGDFTAAALGARFVVGLRKDGSLAAAGDNTYGQCEVPTGNDFVAVAAADYHALALRRDGSISAWGQDLSNNWIDRLKPPGKGHVAIGACSEWNAALRYDGSLVTWSRSHWPVGGEPTGGRWSHLAIGSYGRMVTLSAPIPGDVVSDGRLDWKDLGHLGANWGKTYDIASGVRPFDLNADGSVDVLDLVNLSGFWLVDNR